MSHWAIQYINKPWSADGHGPNSFSCWGLIHHVYKTHLKITLPDISVDGSDIRASMKAFRNNPEFVNWDEIEESTLKEFDAVLMSLQKRPVHVGIFIKPSITEYGVLHSVEGFNVVFQDLVTLKSLGYWIHGCYRYANLT